MESAVGETFVRRKNYRNLLGAYEGQGARALGNRSILAAANDFSGWIKSTMIKCVIFGCLCACYYGRACFQVLRANPKNVTDDFMSVCFQSKPKAKEDISASMHPRDKTIRPQIVRKEANPRSHAECHIPYLTPIKQAGRSS